MLIVKKLLIVKFSVSPGRRELSPHPAAQSIRLARKAMKLMKSLVLRFLDLVDCSSARISNKMLIKRLKI